MERTQKAIKNEIDTLEADIANKKNYRKNCPKIVELEKEIQQLRQQYFEENQSTIDCWESDLEALKDELKKKKSEKALYIPEKLEKWFRKYKSGVSFGYGGIKIIWISPDERFVILTCPGATAGTGTAMGTGGYYYALSSHYLVDTLESDSHVGRNSYMKEVEGRLTKDAKKELIKLAEEKAGYTFDLKK